jgi:hypothetical protein
MEPQTTSTAAPARRVLVLANVECAGAPLMDTIVAHAGAGDAEVLVVAPALMGRLDYWADDDVGYRQAAARLEASLAACERRGLRLRGEIGDPDPLQALEDAMATFRPDAVIIATHPYAEANWLEREVVAAARERHPDQEIRHAVVDGSAGADRGDDEAGDSRWTIRRPARLVDHVILWGAVLLAIFGSLLWVLGGLAADVSESALITWALIVDLGFKLLLAVVVGVLFLGRAPADRDRL